MQAPTAYLGVTLVQNKIRFRGRLSPADNFILSDVTKTDSAGFNMLNLISTITPPSFSRAWFTAAHPDLPIIATCFSDKSVRIYSLTSFTLLSTISGGHKRSIRTCSWKPNLKAESVLGTGSFDATVGIWRSSQIAPAAGFSSEGLTEHKHHHDGDDDDDDDEEWRFAIVLEGHESEVKSISWSAGGNLLATSSRDKSIWIWEEVAEGDFETIAVLQEHEGDVKCVVWHPEEELVASGSYDTEIRLWREDGDDWGCVEVLRGHSSTVWALDWEPSAGISSDEDAIFEEQHSPRLVSCSDDMTIRIWKKHRSDGDRSKMSGDGQWREQATLPHTHELAIYSVAWGQGGRIVSIGADGRLVVYQERAVANPAATNGAETMKYDKDEFTDPKSAITKVTNGSPSQLPSEAPLQRETEWVVLAEVQEAHGVFEINHVCWARRGSSHVIVTTGDDGVTKVWEL